MNKFQLKQVVDYIDAEYMGIVSRMTAEERAARLSHWAKEIGGLDFYAVMAAVRKLSRGQYMPRTSEVIAEVEQTSKPVSRKPSCRIFAGTDGELIVDLRYPDGSEWITGYLSRFPEWMQTKFRWIADPTPENTAAWDALILDGDTTLMAMEEVTA